MKRVSDRFLQLGVIAVLIGMGLGVWMGKSQDFTLSPVHAHLNLLGFVAMFLYGLFYRTFPQVVGKLSTLHFTLAVPGVIFMIPALGMMLVGRTEALPFLLIGEVLSVLGMVIFAVNVFRATGKAG